MIPAPAFFREMFEYVRWGDQQSLMAARSVPDELYYKDFGLSHGSIHKMLVHMMAAQWTWLSRWRGQSPPKLETAEDYPTRILLEQRWPLVHAAMMDFVAHQSPSALARTVNYRNTRGETFTLPLANLLLHVIDHATYHRGQLNSLIKKAGGTPVYVSFQLWSLNKDKHW
jgi:uncharacterized damage-inducible protein DinB